MRTDVHGPPLRPRRSLEVAAWGARTRAGIHSGASGPGAMEGAG
jgi:hypothetical protein